jgi:flagellar hook-associated protein 3 FlgL
MAISGIASSLATSLQAQLNMQNQLDVLSRQLGTGQKAAVYSDLGSQAGIAVGLDSQLSAISGFDDTIATVGTTLGIAQETLTQIANVGSLVQQGVNQPAGFALDQNGQTQIQASAAVQLGQALDLLNTRVGDNYLFSGAAVSTASVETTDHILNGNGAQAGLKQIISERSQADLGATGLGRLVIPPAAGSTVSIGEDVAGSPFGFKLSGISSSLAGSSVTQPSGSPKSMSVTLGSNPNDGDTVQFSLILPDGTSQTITLQATSAASPGPGQFAIGTTPAATAANLQAALTTAVGSLAQTALPAASAIAAANNFFNSNPPLRVAGPPFNSAIALQNGTSANTVFWYTGDAGAAPARQTAVAQVGPSLTVAYGMRASEQGISSIVANIAALAATSFAPGNPNAAASYAALTERVGANLAGQAGQQTVSDIEADIANAQVTTNNAKTVNQQTKAALTNLMQGIDGVSADQIGAQILALQNNLQASLSTTVRISQLSLVNYLGASTG